MLDQPFVTVQLLVTLFLVVLLWCLQARLRKQEFFRLWAWAWTAYAVHLVFEAPGPWRAPAALGAGAVLIATVAGFLQFPLLAFGAASLSAPARAVARGRLWVGLGIAAVAGILAFAASAGARADPGLSYAVRAAPRVLALGAARTA